MQELKRDAIVFQEKYAELLKKADSSIKTKL